MGPTGSGKTHLAIELVKHLPCDIISVDSAMVYRGMDIGTAKPTLAEQAIAPHRLIDICDPSQAYSAGQFCLDATREIKDILQQGRIPLLVGGTMLYFRALQQGLAELPSTNPEVRAQLQQDLTQLGIAELHKRLQKIDPIAAQRIKTTDTQRITRALEVYMMTGKTLSSFLTADQPKQLPYTIINIAIAPPERSILHQRISKRFATMLNMGFVAEVEKLYARGDLTLQMPSIRSVGYRQIWEYLSGILNYEQMQEKGIIATRQLAKRQMTWLRSWSNLKWFNSEEDKISQNVLQYLKND